jgi:hypothetical protein
MPSCTEAGSLNEMRAMRCAMPRGPECQGILGQAQHPRGSPPTLLTRFGPMRLLPLPEAEEHLEGEIISRRRGDKTK